MLIMDSKSWAVTGPEELTEAQAHVVRRHERRGWEPQYVTFTLRDKVVVHLSHGVGGQNERWRAIGPEGVVRRERLKDLRCEE